MLDVEIKKESLTKALVKANQIVDVKALSIYSCVKMEFKASENSVTITALSSYGVEMQTTCEIGVMGIGMEPEETICVPLAELYKVVSKFPSDLVKLVAEKNSLIISPVGKKKPQYTITMFGVEQFPEFKTLKSGIDIPFQNEDFISYTDRTVSIVDVKQNRNYKGVLFSYQAETGILDLVATDGLRLAIVRETNIALGTEDIKFVFPVKTMELFRYMAKLDPDGTCILKYNAKTQSAMFSCQDCIVSASMLDTNFPDYQRLIAGINKDVMSRYDLPYSELRESLDRISTLLEVDVRKLEFHAENEAITISARNAAKGEGIEEIALPPNSPTAEFRANKDFIMDFLNSADSDSVSLYYKDEKSFMVLEPTGDNKYKYLFMGMSR